MALPAPTDLNPVERFVRAQFIDLFLAQNRRAQIGVIASWLLIGATWLQTAPTLGAGLWVALMAVVSWVRYRYTAPYVLAGTEDERPTRVALSLMLSALALASLLFAFPSFSEQARAGLSIIFIAIATAASATTGGYRRVFMSFSGSLLIGLALAWTVSEWNSPAPWVGVGLGLLHLLYLGFLENLGRDIFRIFHESCEIRYRERDRNAELQHALETARAANRAKTQFLAAASHDLRQPLHSINALVAAIGLRSLDERSRSITDLLGHVAQSLSAQLDGLLDVSKLDAGVITPVLAPVNLSQLAQRHAASLSKQVQLRGLSLEVQAEPDILIESDSALLQRIFSNLTDNALKFTRQGQIDVVLNRTDGGASLTVRDTGMGIPQSEQALVFREFYQVSPSERDREKGLGLGLSIVKRLADLLHIEIALESTAGIGTAVTLRFQTLTRPPVPPPAEPPTTVPRLALSVLVVDDESDVRTSMRWLLEELQCRVVVAGDDASAFELAQYQSLDLLICDYRLGPLSNGLDTIAKIKTLHPHLQTLVITGDITLEKLREVHAAGLPVLHKPVTLDKLVGALRELTAHARPTVPLQAPPPNPSPPR